VCVCVCLHPETFNVSRCYVRRCCVCTQQVLCPADTVPRRCCGCTRRYCPRRCCGCTLRLFHAVRATRFSTHSKISGLRSEDGERVHGVCAPHAFFLSERCVLPTPEVTQSVSNASGNPSRWIAMDCHTTCWRVWRCNGIKRVEGRGGGGGGIKRDADNSPIATNARVFLLHTHARPPRDRQTACCQTCQRQATLLTHERRQRVTCESGEAWLVGCAAQRHHARPQNEDHAQSVSMFFCDLFILSRPFTLQAL